MDLALYDYQEAAVDEVRAAYGQGCRAPLLVLPTGGGKTVTFGYIARRARDKGLRVLILVHRRELLLQSSATLTRWSVDHGLISPSHSISDAAVQVAMTQTLVRRLPLDRTGRFRFDLVIIDECHHVVTSNTWGQILAHSPEARLLGVSATPCRQDGKGLGVEFGGVFDRMIVGPTVQELIDRGKLARPVVFATEKVPDVSGIKTRNGDYQRDALESVVNTLEFARLAVEDYRAHLDGAPTVVFTVSTAHGAQMVESFRRDGYRAALLTGKTPDREREGMIRDLGRGALHALCSCNVVSEGTDIPTVVGAMLLRPTQSLALARQQMGRALRVLPGKDKAIILDRAGNTWRHGLPQEPVEWSLAGAKREARAAWTCRACGAAMPAGSPACPACGTATGKGNGEAAPPIEQKQQGEIEMQGDLRELTPELRRSVMERRRYENAAAGSVDDLRRLGHARGYRSADTWATKEWERQQQYRKGGHGYSGH